MNMGSEIDGVAKSHKVCNLQVLFDGIHKSRGNSALDHDNNAFLHGCPNAQTATDWADSEEGVEKKHFVQISWGKQSKTDFKSNSTENSGKSHLQVYDWNVRPIFLVEKCTDRIRNIRSS